MNTVEDHSLSVISMTSQVLQTLQITLPLMLSMNVKEEDPYGDEGDLSMLTTHKGGVSNVSMGELLYPSFNQVVPQLVEHVIPQLSVLENP